MKRAKILFFTAGIQISVAERAILDELATTQGVQFRAVQFVDESSLEQCDAVAGSVPENYAKAFPSVEEFLNRTASAKVNSNEAASVGIPPVTPKPLTAAQKKKQAEAEAKAAAAAAATAAAEAKAAAAAAATAAAETPPATPAAPAWGAPPVTKDE